MAFASMTEEELGPSLCFGNKKAMSGVRMAQSN